MRWEPPNVPALLDGGGPMSGLTASDGSNASFAVYPDHADRGVWVVQLIDAEWTRLAAVGGLA